MSERECVGVVSRRCAKVLLGYVKTSEGGKFKNGSDT